MVGAALVGRFVIVAFALAGLALVALSGVAAMAYPRGFVAGDRAAAGTLCAGAAVAGAAAIAALASHGGAASVAWALPGGVIRFHLDAIGAMFLVQDLVIAAAGAIYGTSYWSPVDHPDSARQVRLFYGLTAAGLGLVFIAGDALVFLVGWELMALSAFMAFTADDRDPAVRDAGAVYLFCTKSATLALMGMFVVWQHATGTFALVPLHGEPPVALFALALVGFGVKAGVMPLHIWLPGAHASAPSHVSALMSGVMIKAGIYGLIRILGLCADAPARWGETVFVVGVVSSVLGVVLAIGQHDIKRLLAYHSVENIGIIMLGVGMALAGRATGATELVVLGLAGALLHTWNHGLFKSLLFLSAGAVIHATGVRDLDRMGGIARRMPRTSLLFLLGAVAICGLPPLNGFVSEFLVYSGFLRSMLAPGRGWLLGGVGAPALALTGALALLCFAKVFGIAFLGEPRSEQVARAHPAPVSMVAPMGALAVLCVAIGVGSVGLAPVLDAAVGDWGVHVQGGVASLAPLGSISIVAVATIALLGATWALLARRLSGEQRDTVLTWDCGYAAPTARMQYTASSFAELVLGLFAWATLPVSHAPHLAAGRFPAPSRLESHVRDAALDLVVRPGASEAARLLGALHWLQRGSLQAGLVYILLALIVAFAWF